MSKSEAIAEVRALMRANGITLDELRALMQLQLPLETETSPSGECKTAMCADNTNTAQEAA